MGVVMAKYQIMIHLNMSLALVACHCIWLGVDELINQ